MDGRPPPFSPCRASYLAPHRAPPYTPHPPVAQVAQAQASLAAAVGALSELRGRRVAGDPYEWLAPFDVTAASPAAQVRP